jgi:hypothetical protein
MEQILFHNGFPMLLQIGEKSLSLLISLKRAQKLTLGEQPEPSADGGSVKITVRWNEV